MPQILHDKVRPGETFARSRPGFRVDRCRHRDTATRGNADRHAADPAVPAASAAAVAATGAESCNVASKSPTTTAVAATTNATTAATTTGSAAAAATARGSTSDSGWDGECRRAEFGDDLSSFGIARRRRPNSTTPLHATRHANARTVRQQSNRTARFSPDFCSPKVRGWRRDHSFAGDSASLQHDFVHSQ